MVILYFINYNWINKTKNSIENEYFRMDKILHIAKMGEFSTIYYWIFIMI